MEQVFCGDVSQNFVLVWKCLIYLLYLLLFFFIPFCFFFFWGWLTQLHEEVLTIYFLLSFLSWHQKCFAPFELNFSSFFALLYVCFSASLCKNVCLFEGVHNVVNFFEICWRFSLSLSFLLIIQTLKILGWSFFSWRVRNKKGSTSSICKWLLSLF